MGLLAGLMSRFGCGFVARHRAVRYRRSWWQLRLEVKHRVWAWWRDFKSDWREFWLDLAEWKEGKK